MTKSYTYRFQEISVKTIIVEYADAIPITDAVISGINSSYVVSNTAIAPVPTVTWHGTTLTRDTHYTLSWNHSNSAGTATVNATATIELYNMDTTTLIATDHAPGGNILQGSDNDVQVTDGQVNSQTPCVLSVVNGVVGFYPVANNYNGVIPAHKAYYLTTITP